MSKLIAFLGILLFSGCIQYRDEIPPKIIKQNGVYGYYDVNYSGKWFPAPYAYVYYEEEIPYWGDFERRSWGLPLKGGK